MKYRHPLATHQLNLPLYWSVLVYLVLVSLDSQDGYFLENCQLEQNLTAQVRHFLVPAIHQEYFSFAGSQLFSSHILQLLFLLLLVPLSVLLLSLLHAVSFFLPLPLAFELAWQDHLLIIPVPVLQLIGYHSAADSLPNY